MFISAAKTQKIQAQVLVETKNPFFMNRMNKKVQQLLPRYQINMY